MKINHHFTVPCFTKGIDPMKVLMLNGSPRANGNTAIALSEMEKVFVQEGIEAETV